MKHASPDTVVHAQESTERGAAKNRYSGTECDLIRCATARLRRDLPTHLLALSITVAGCGFKGPPQQNAPTPSNAPTFTKDIAPIVFQHCCPCHRPGESAPFSLLSYKDVRRRGRQIVEVTRSRYMPPWLPAPDSVPFVGKRVLSEESIEAIAAWVAHGAPLGDPTHLPESPQAPGGWRLGEPDLVVQMPKAYQLPAEGTDVFRNFVIPLPITTRQFVKGVDFRPGNARVIHHAVFLIDRTGGSRAADQREEEPGFDGMFLEGAHSPDGHFIGWIPGKTPVLLDEEMAWRLDVETDLVLQLHMLPAGKSETVQSELAFYFTDRRPTRLPVMIRIGSQQLDIPAGDGNYVIEDSYTLPVPVLVTSLIPHAHYLGRRMEASATLPDGTKLTLIHIPEWDFNWQDEFRCADPIALPRGTQFEMRYVYDNSAENPRNPHQPPRRVTYGPRTHDEMGDLWIQVLPQDSDDRPALLADARRKRLATDIAGYETALRNDPRDAESHHAVALCYQRIGNPEMAIGHFEQAISLAPENARACNNLALLLQSRREVTRAVRLYEQALRIDPDYDKAHYNLGLVLEKTGNKDEATKHYRRALSANPYFANAHNNLGNVLFAEGDVERAERRYRQAVEINPDHFRAHLNLGNLYHFRRDLPAAIHHYEQVIELNPDSADAYYRLGVALEEQGDSRGAIRHYRKALHRNPDFTEAHYRLAMPLIQHSEAALGLEHYRHALALRPDWPPPINNLAWTLATHPDPNIRDAREAVRLSQQASELTNFREPGYLDTLAAAYAANGDFRQAIDTVQRALQLLSEQGPAELVAAIQRRLRLYEQSKPYVDRKNIPKSELR